MIGRFIDVVSDVRTPILSSLGVSRVEQFDHSDEVGSQVTLGCAGQIAGEIATERLSGRHIDENTDGRLHA